MLNGRLKQKNAIATPAISPEPDVKVSIDAAMDAANIGLPKLLTPDEVAAWLSVTTKTLERWRKEGNGPRYIKVTSKVVRYRLDEVASFVTERTRSNTIR